MSQDAAPRSAVHRAARRSHGPSRPMRFAGTFSAATGSPHSTEKHPGTVTKSEQRSLGPVGVEVPPDQAEHHVRGHLHAYRQTSRAIRRVLFRRVLAVPPATAIHLGPVLPPASSGLPADSGGPPSIVRAEAPRCPLLDLAPGGVYLAAQVTLGTGGLLHHRFTLTGDRNPRRSAFCGTVPRVTPGGCWPPPCPVEPGRSSGDPPGVPRGRPPGSSAVPNMLPPCRPPSDSPDPPPLPYLPHHPAERRRATPCPGSLASGPIA